MIIAEKCEIFSSKPAIEDVILLQTKATLSDVTAT